MAVRAGRATNHHGATVIPVFRHAVRGPVAARFAREDNLVGGLLLAAEAILFFVLSVGGGIGGAVR